MAKARPIPDLRPDDAYGAAAARIVTVRAQELADHSSGVLDMGDIERVHDMRVASRRLRAALEVFRPCFPRKAHKAALKSVKELADALGQRRDRDVAIEALEAFASQLDPADRHGVESLVGELMIQQLQANEALRPYVSASRVARLHAELRDLAARAKGLDR
jgi:CHAD domain-containing protein